MSFEKVKKYFKDDSRMCGGGEGWGLPTANRGWELIFKLHITPNGYGLFNANTRKWDEFGDVGENFFEELRDQSITNKFLMYSKWITSKELVILYIYNAKKGSKVYNAIAGVSSTSIFM